MALENNRLICFRESFAQKSYLLFVFLFLALPKIAISNNSGILIGEIILFFIAIGMMPRLYFGLIYLTTINKVVFTFTCFLLFYVLIGSLISGAFEGLFPEKASLQTLRIILYSMIIGIVSSSAARHVADEKLYRALKWGYLTELLIAGVYFYWAYLIAQPSLGDLLGSYTPGTRIIPMYGLAFGTNGEFPLEVVGGGSGNLLGSHALFICILAYIFEKKPSREFALISISILVLALAQSRGGVLTICLWGLYRFWQSFRTKKSYKNNNITLNFGILAFSALAFYYLSEHLPLLARIESVLESGTLDSSSSTRLINYADVFRTWARDPLAILIGLGFDERILELRSGWTIVESLILSVLFCGGLISIILLVIFYIQVFNRRNINVWWHALFLFLIFELFINWSVTGGDLIGPPALYAIFLMLGLATKSNIKVQNDPY